MCIKVKGVHMRNTMRFIFLSNLFFDTYDREHYPEIEHKPERPYMQMYIDVDGIKFAIPFRSNIPHYNAFFTNRAERCGLDYSKAVVIKDDAYIDNTRTPHLRPEEFEALRGKEDQIKRQFRDYILLYKFSKNNMHRTRDRLIVRFSTLQYFEEEIENIN